MLHNNLRYGTVILQIRKKKLEQFAIFEESIPQILDDIKYQTQAQFDYDKVQNVLCSKITITLSEYP